MSLERKDVRAKLDDDLHAALKVICDHDEIDMGVFVEQLLVPVIRKRVHDVTVLAERFRRLGITGSGRESPGTPGSGREWPGIAGNDRESGGER